MRQLMQLPRDIFGTKRNKNNNADVSMWDSHC